MNQDINRPRKSKELRKDLETRIENLLERLSIATQEDTPTIKKQISNLAMEYKTLMGHFYRRRYKRYEPIQDPLNTPEKERNYQISPDPLQEANGFGEVNKLRERPRIIT